jgi:hypothetical protein
MDQPQSTESSPTPVVTRIPAGTPFGAHVAELGAVWAEAHHALGPAVAKYEEYLRRRAAVAVTA